MIFTHTQPHVTSRDSCKLDMVPVFVMNADFKAGARNDVDMPVPVQTERHGVNEGTVGHVCIVDFCDEFPGIAISKAVVLVMAVVRTEALYPALVQNSK